MKRLIIIALCIGILFVSNDLFAQKKQRSNIQLGVKIAPSINWLKVTAKDFSRDGSSFKLSWGFISDFQFADKYFFSTGFNVLSMGGKMNYTDSVIFGDNSPARRGELKRSFSIKYVEIPISIKMKTRQFGDLTYFGQIGMGLGMRISAYSDDDFYLPGSSTALTTNDNKIEDQVNFLRFSMILSAGVEYSLGGSTSLFGAVTFNNGFTNVFDFKNNIAPYVAADAVSNSLDLTIGLIF